MDIKRISRRKLIWRTCTVSGTVLLGCFGYAQAASLNIQTRYSPKNRKRPNRPQTRYIVLHTTEGREAGSFTKIWNRGEAHYFVNPKGRVTRIINKSKIATHAGRSMWEGRGPIDNYGIGIEVVGYHNKDLTSAQYTALKELLRQLMKIYSIPDERVITHSMVAYGRPNRFHPYKHRGRKRCGMIFAKPEVRKRLGLNGKPVSDIDVTEGRLRVADRELYNYLFQRDLNLERASVETKVLETDQLENIVTKNHTVWDIARDLYDNPETSYIFPGGQKITGDKIRDWGKIPAGTRVVIADVDVVNGFEGFYEVRNQESAKTIAGDAYDDKTTIYFLPSGMVRTGYEMKRRNSTSAILEKLPEKTRVLVGYVYGGHIKRNRTASRIAGRKWNYPSTFYRLPDGKILSGDEINDSSIPINTLVLFQS